MKEAVYAEWNLVEEKCVLLLQMACSNIYEAFVCTHAQPRHIDKLPTYIYRPTT